MTSPGKDRLLFGRIVGIAARHAPAWRPGGDNAAAIAALAEITDAGALREAALKKFDANDSTTDDYPDTADWHASEQGQEERRQIATQDVDALSQFVGFGLAEARRLLEVIDGVPGVKAVPLGSSVGPLEGTTHDEARDAWAEREGITWWPEARDAELARQHREGIT